jgi:site-specific recombinase XerC
MFKQPKIFIPQDKTERAYILYYYNGKRFREYNGNKLNLEIYPNHCVRLADKKRLLSKLQFEVTKALESGWDPNIVEVPASEISLKDALTLVLDEKLNSNLCDLYKRNLKAVCRMFIDFIPSKMLNEKCDMVTLDTVESFLNKFQSSERNYINRRRLLHTFFNEMVRKGFLVKNVVKETKSARAKASLHEPYPQEQLKLVLNYLKIHYPNLHLCCLLTYGCFLRPHHEIRLLKMKHIVHDYGQIQLSGSENKSKRIRTAYIPQYIQDELRVRLTTLDDPEANIFTLKKIPYNVGYFNVMWGKAKIKMIQEGILSPKQTIYSFRHTAVVNVYRKTKDLQILQQLLQHSNMIVTLNYLRGLGEVNDERLKDVLPEL